MNPDLTRRVLLGALLALLGILALRSGWWRSPAGAAGQARGAAEVATAPSSASTEAGLELGRLEQAGAQEPVVRRNLFRFSEPAAPAGPPAIAGRSAAPPRAAPDPVGTGPAPPRFTLIGVVEPHGEGTRVAVLSDGRGVYHGAAGDIIEGQFRVVSVGAAFVELTQIGSNATQVIQLQGERAGGPALQ